MIDNRSDNRLLECVFRDEQKKLEKRVVAVEFSHQKLVA
jgi:hypothetical protein